MSKSLEDMNEPELRAQMDLTATAIKMSLPPRTGFIVLAATFDGGIAQYASNVQHEDAAKWMIETLTRWGLGDFVPRVGE